jgi:hypothetical protein
LASWAGSSFDWNAVVVGVVAAVVGVVLAAVVGVVACGAAVVGSVVDVVGSATAAFVSVAVVAGMAPVEDARKRAEAMPPLSMQPMPAAKRRVFMRTTLVAGLGSTLGPT